MRLTVAFEAAKLRDFSALRGEQMGAVDSDAKLHSRASIAGLSLSDAERINIKKKPKRMINFVGGRNIQCGEFSASLPGASA